MRTFISCTLFRCRMLRRHQWFYMRSFLLVLLVLCILQFAVLPARYKMRVPFLACVLFPCLGLATADSSTTTELLWPLPRSAQFGSTVYSLNPETFSFVGTGPGATTQGGSSNSLKNAFKRYTNLIFHTPAPFFPSGGSSGAVQQQLTSLEVYVMSDSETLGLDTNETCMHLPGYNYYSSVDPVAVKSNQPYTGPKIMG